MLTVAGVSLTLGSLLLVSVLAFIAVRRSVRAQRERTDPGRRGFLTGALSGAGAGLAALVAGGVATFARAFLGLGLRVKQDITSQYADLINAAMPKWTDLINLAKDEVIDGVGRAAYARVLAEEASMWARRLEALSNGELKVYRFLALKLG